MSAEGERIRRTGPPFPPCRPRRPGPPFPLGRAPMAGVAAHEGSARHPESGGAEAAAIPDTPPRSRDPLAPCRDLPRLVDPGGPPDFGVTFRIKTGKEETLLRRKRQEGVCPMKLLGGRKMPQAQEREGPSHLVLNHA